MATVRLPTHAMVDAPSCHATFQRALGFCDGYGHNWDAWIDVMSDLRAEPGLAALHLSADEVLHLVLPDAVAWRLRVPDVFHDLVDCTAFVNQRYLALGEPPALALVLE